MKNIGYIEDFDQAHMFWEAGLRVGLAKANRKFNEVRSQPGIATGMGCSFGVANLISLAVQESASTKIAVCPPERIAGIARTTRVWTFDHGKRYASRHDACLGNTKEARQYCVYHLRR